MKIAVNMALNPGYLGRTRAIESAVTTEPDDFGNELTPEQARRYARALNAAADAIDANERALQAVKGAQVEVDSILAPATDLPIDGPAATL